MPQWELMAQVFYDVSHGGGITGGVYDAGHLWGVKHKDGTSTWDSLAKLAAEGWELVAVTPINVSGFTHQLLFTFKRPMQSEGGN